MTQQGSRGGQIDFDIKNAEQVLKNLFTLLDVANFGNPTIMPLPTILLNGPAKPGLSPLAIATSIITRQSQALEQRNSTWPAGGISEAMEYIRVKEIVKAIQRTMRVDLGTLPSIAPVTTSGGPGTATIAPLFGYAQAY